MRKKLISKNHDDFLIEHFDLEKIFDLLQRKYYWIDCDKQTSEYVKICDIYQRIKTFRHKSYDELQFLSISKNFWKKIIMNFVIDLSSSKREKIVYDFIFVIMNRCIKMIKYIFTTIKFDVAKLTKMFFIEIVFKFDMLANIVSDREFVFINAFWSTLCYHCKIKRRLNTAFHSQTNDLIERQNQILKHYLRIFVDAKQTQWTNHLFLIEFVYNNVKHFIIDQFSFYLMYDYHFEIHYEIENNFIVKKISIAKKRVRWLHDMRNSLTQRLESADAQQTKHYNRKHKFMFYAIENLIMLSTKNLKQKRLSKKLSHKFAKLFKIENKINAQTYRLTLFNIYRIHNTFHVFLLKKYHHRADDEQTKSMLQTSKLIDDEKQWEIKKILNRTKSKKDVWYKIKWFDWDSKYNQWLSKKKFERASNLVREYENARTQKRRKKK